MLQAMYEQWSRLACLPFTPNMGFSFPPDMGISLTPGADIFSPPPPVASPAVEPAPSPATLPTSQFLADAFESSLGTLRYKLFIPAGYRGQPLPLVVMLHGYGQRVDDFATGTEMNTYAATAECFVLYPEQPSFGLCGGCWNWFDPAHQQRGQGDVAQIAGAVQKVMDDYAVDADKVFVAGMSAGGAMAIVLAHAYPELFSAVGCHSGLPLGCAGDSGTALRVMRDGVDVDDIGQPGTQPVRVIVFHGDSDATVNCVNGEAIVRHSLAAVPQAGRTGGTLQAEEEVGNCAGRDYTRAVHRSADGAVLAEHWLVHGAGHAWSGGSIMGSYADDRGPAASKAMLSFFLQ
jgi:poly(hydroxyalkanoate) depolymerase family esterase